MIYHMSKEVARNRADTMPALPAVVNAAVAAKYFLSRIQKFFKKSVKICKNHQEDGVLESKEEERWLSRTFQASKWSAH